MSSNAQQPHLLRRFGLLQATALNMTNMIGVGPFITIPALMSYMNGPQAMLGWLFAREQAPSLTRVALWLPRRAAEPASRH